MNDTNHNHPAASSTALVERSFEGNEMVHSTDQATVLAQAAVATMQARYTLAKRFPRNIDAVRQNLLKDCQRPGFAASAMYKKPIGDGITGLTIRFAEAAVRCMGNVHVETQLISDTDTTRITRVVVNELESNITYHKDIVVEKTVERKVLKKGQKPLSSRHNSYGNIVYLVPATDDEILSKEANLVSKAMRTELLRLLPVDIKEECIDMITQVNASEIKKDPDAARKKMVSRFDEKGVTADAVAKYLGRTDLSAVSPDEIAHMAAVYQALNDNEATWNELLAASPYIDHDVSGDEDANKKSVETASRVAELKNKREAKKVEKQAAKKPVGKSVDEVPQANNSDGEVLCDPKTKAQVEGALLAVHGDKADEKRKILFGDKDILTIPLHEVEMVLEILQDEKDAAKK